MEPTKQPPTALETEAPPHLIMQPRFLIPCPRRGSLAVESWPSVVPVQGKTMRPPVRTKTGKINRSLTSDLCSSSKPLLQLSRPQTKPSRGQQAYLRTQARSDLDVDYILA